MGCVSSTFLHHDDEISHIGTSAFSHHFVSLTSTTYGLLSLDPPPASSPTTPPPPRIPSSESPEVINSWELMAGLDNESFRFSPLPLRSSRPSNPRMFSPKLNCLKENSNPNRRFLENPSVFKPKARSGFKYSLDEFEELCPPKGENKVVMYSTTLRGVRRTFEACNAVRSAIEGLGFVICERDVSMDRGFREELRELMKDKEIKESVPPRVFVRGRYLGGSEEVLRIHEEGCLSELLDGLPKAKIGEICEGCGGARFLPCFCCNGSCKIVVIGKEDLDLKQARRSVVVRCSECNENGLVLCPICS